MALTVGLLSDDLFDVEAPSLSVDGLNLALSALKSSTHDLSPDVGGGREVGLSGLSALA